MLSSSRFAPLTWLLATTFLVVTSFIGATLYSGRVASRIDGMAADIASNADPSIRYLGAVRTELHTMYNLLTLSIFDGRSLTPMMQELEAHTARMEENVTLYRRLPFFPEEYPIWQTTDRYLLDAVTKISAVAAKLDSGDVNGAEVLLAGALTSAVQRADVELERIIEFDADQGSHLSAEITKARRTAMRASYALDAVAVMLAIVMLGVGGKASQRYVRALQAARQAEEQMTKKLEAVASAAFSIIQKVPHAHSLNNVLQATVDTATAVAGADMAALGLGTDPSRPFDRFVHAGIDQSVIEQCGVPHPSGVLAAVIEKGRTLRIADVAAEHRLHLPPWHPPIGSFLGVVVRHEQKAIGHLFLSKRPGTVPFTEQDAHAVELLANFAAIATQNASLYAEVRRQVSAREDVLAMVSHDLRSPLATVTLAAAMLQKTAGPDRVVQQHTERIVRSAARMDRMIGDLLTAARLREGRLAIDPKMQDVPPLVSEAVEPFLSAAAAKGVALHVEFAYPLCPLFCDGGRVMQVLSNLIGNALKFTPRGGAIIVSARVRDVPRSEVLFSIKDTGVGIAENAISRVFDRLWQKREDASQGNGLGLFIAKGIIDAHRGRIWVESQIGKGSDFQFTIPISEEHDAVHLHTTH